MPVGRSELYEDDNYADATDFLEILEPSLPRGFLELTEEARNVEVEIELDYTDEVESQEANLPRPVLVTVMEPSSSVLNVGVTKAPGISTERIPPRFSAGRCSLANQLGLVGPWNKTVSSVLSGSLTQHYRLYRGGLPHAVFRTDYIERLRALLPPLRRTEGESTSPPETG